jgi:hypothetical protein
VETRQLQVSIIKKILTLVKEKIPKPLSLR